MNKEELFSDIKKYGEYRTQHIFGGVGVFFNNAMSVYLYDNKVYLRAKGGLQEYLKSEGCEHFEFQKRKTRVSLDYFRITTLKNKDQVFERAIYEAIRDKQKEIPERIRDLSNMHFKLERMLIRVGIETVDMFEKEGAINSFLKLSAQYPDLNIETLWRFYGAINNIHWSLIMPNEKEKLTVELNKLSSKSYSL